MTVSCHKCGLGMKERSIITLPFTKAALQEALADLEFYESIPPPMPPSVPIANPPESAPLAETAPVPRKPLFGAI